MKGNDEWDTHTGDVICNGENHGKVPMIAASTGRRYRTGVGEDLQ
jgi:hypothetical protein